MCTVEYNTEFLHDGHLPCPKEIKKKLHLSNGSKVKVAITPLEQGQITKLKGIWDGIEITDEDIKSARKEMWVSLGTNL